MDECIRKQTVLNMIDAALTKDEAHAVAEFIDINLISSIRNDIDIDSMLWLRNIVHAYEKLCEYSGYIGTTEIGVGETDA